MRFLYILSFILLLSFGISCSQTKTPIYSGNLSFLPLAEDQDMFGSGRGAEQWHDQNAVPVYFANESKPFSADKYYRFAWTQIETSEGQFNWSVFDKEIKDAIDNKQTFSFGIMPTCPSCKDDGKSISIDASIASYPAYLHQQMQAEDVKDWVSPLSNMWIPNWNSPSYLKALQRLNDSVANHLSTQTYSGIKFSDVVRYIDLRGYGSYGEWHESGIVVTMDDHPKGTQATKESLQKIVDIHLDAYRNFRLVALMSSLDAELLRNTKIPTDIGHYILHAQTNAGHLGIRRDNWGATDSYIKTYMENHPVEHKGVLFRKLIGDRWKTAPILGEPIHDAATWNDCAMGDLESQVKKYHASSIGNGNFYNANDPCVQENFRAAAAAAGYRLLLVGGHVDSAVKAGNEFTIQLYWQNRGAAPLYDAAKVYFQLYQLHSDSLAWEQSVEFSPTLLLPADSAISMKEQLKLPASVPAGHYNLRIQLRDPKNYRAPFPLALKGRQENGAYTIRSLEILSAP